MQFCIVTEASYSCKEMVDQADTEYIIEVLKSLSNLKEIQRKI